jgi:glycosyltransferase involved in cell wall biosynthesis
MLRVLALTNLFPNRFEPTRATYNYEIFSRLAERAQLTLFVPISFMTLVRNPKRIFEWLSSDSKYPFANYFLYIHLPGFFIKFNSFLMALCLVLQFPKKVLFQQYNVCFGSWLYPDSDALRLLSRLRKLRLVVMALGTDVNLGLRATNTRAGTLRVLHGAAMVILVSEALRKIVIVEGVKESATKVVYTGVDRSKFYPCDKTQARRNLAIPSDKRIVLFVGSLIRTKGCFELVEAVTHLNSKKPGSIMLLVIGAGSARKELELHIHSLGATEFVRLIGLIEPAKLGQWYCAADLFCLPSHREGVPNVILESLACGTPVVATAVGGIPEVLNEGNGHLVNVNDVPDIASGIDYALSFSFDLRTILTSAGRFDWDDCVSGILNQLRVNASQP